MLKTLLIKSSLCSLSGEDRAGGAWYFMAAVAGGSWCSEAGGSWCFMAAVAGGSWCSSAGAALFKFCWAEGVAASAAGATEEDAAAGGSAGAAAKPVHQRLQTPALHQTQCIASSYIAKPEAWAE